MAKAIAMALWCAACGSSPGAPLGTYSLELTPAPPYPAHVLDIVAYDIIKLDTYTAIGAFVDESTIPAPVTFRIHDTFPGEGGTLDESWTLTMDSEGGTGTATIMRQQSQVVATKQ